MPSISNADLLREIKKVQATQVVHDDRLMKLEERNKIADVAKEAVEKYKEGELMNRKERLQDQGMQRKNELLKYLIPFIIAATLLLYALTKSYP